MMARLFSLLPAAAGGFGFAGVSFRGCRSPSGGLAPDATTSTLPVRHESAADIGRGYAPQLLAPALHGLSCKL